MAAMNRTVKSISLTASLFSFDQTKKPNIRASFPKVTDDKAKMEVVNMIAVMNEGSSMILLTKDTKIEDQLEFKLFFLSQDNQNIYCGSTKNKLFSTRDIINVSTLDDETLLHFQNALDMKGISTIGLRSLMFSIDLQQNSENKYRLYFIGESHRISYIWFQGLQTLYRNSNPTGIKSLPLIVSNRLRIGHKNLYHGSKNTLQSSHENKQQIIGDENENANANDDENNDDNNEENQRSHEDLILSLSSIEKDCCLTSKHINDLYSSACRACILDSTEHLTLLSQAMNLKKTNDEIEYLIKQVNDNSINNKNDISEQDRIAQIEELYYFLNSECTAVTLKSYNMQKDMQLSRQ